jgi:predicted molibdopterin-dependent oxidoreductase YjgC
VVVLLGRPSLAEPAAGVVDAARRLAGLPGVAVLSALRRSNIHGALDLGLAPGVLPGRVGLDEGRAWYEHHWAASLGDGRLPAAPGLDTAGILDAAARGGIGALVLLGADPVTDFPDALAAIKGLSGARFVVAVDTFLTPSSRKADVILPAATYAERRGTFTNLEGRISHLGSIVTPPGVAWPDWMIASELAWRLGTDLGFSSVEEIWAEISTVSPLHHGVTYGLLTAPEGSDGVVVPLGAGGHAPGRIRALDPMADPGIASAEVHTIPFSAMAVTPRPVPSNGDGSAAEADAAAEPGEAAAAEPDAAASDPDGMPARPSMLVTVPTAAKAPPARPVRPGLRLVSHRSLWDAGTQVGHSPGLAGLHPDWVARVHPDDLAGLGLPDGTLARLSTGRGSLELGLRADHRVARHSIVVPFNLPDGSVAGLIDAAVAIQIVRVEAITEGVR